MVQSGHSDRLNSAKISPNDKFVISCGKDNKIIVWERSNQKQHSILLGHKASVTDIIFKKNDINIVYSISLDGTIKKWNYLTNSCLKTVKIGIPLTSIEAHIHFYGE